MSSDCMAHHLRTAQLDAEARSPRIERDGAVSGRRHALEQQAFHAHVIAKLLEMNEARCRGTRVNVDRRRAMRRQWQRIRVAERIRLQKPGDAEAARRIGL